MCHDLFIVNLANSNKNKNFSEKSVNLTETQLEKRLIINILKVIE